MRIDIWIDFNCPQSYVSLTKFLSVYNKFKYKNEVDVVYRSYEDEESQNKNKEEIIKEASKYGLKLNYIQRLESTHLPHQMLHLAKKSSCQEKVLLTLLKEKFENGKDISDKTILIDILKPFLNEETIKETLETLPFKNAILLNKENAQRRKIYHLPHYRFNHTIDLNGNPSEEEIKKAIIIMYQKEKTTTYCEEDEDNCYR